MVDTKPLATVTDNYKNSIGRVSAAYKTGVGNASNVIAKGVAAEGLYQEKLQESFASNRRATNLAKVTDSEWKAAAQDKGARRIGEGMTKSLPKFNKGIAEVLSVIQGTDIAPRTSDPMANVDGRVKPLVRNLAAMKK